MTNEAKDQVPEWTMERARATLDTYLRTPISPDEAIARALLAATAEEREACAQLADSFEPTKRLFPFLSDRENEAAEVGQSEAADDIATAIRKRGAP